MKKKNKVLSLALILSFLIGLFPLGAIVPLAAGSDVSTDLILRENKEMRLWYDEPASDDDNRTWDHNKAKNSGWENEALNIGNSYLGAKVFGITERERIQISEKTLYTSGGTQTSGNTNFTETYLHFDHTYSGVSEYERDLVLNDATSHVSYTYNGIRYEREYFTTYPDKVMVIRLTASGSGNLSFTLEPKIPYYVFEGKTGDVTVSEVSNDGAFSVSTLTLEGNLPGSNKSNTEPGYNEGKGTVGFDMDFEAQYRVFANGGTMTASYNAGGGNIDEVDEYANGTVTVSGADSAYIIIALGTNYELDESIFLESNNSKKLSGFAHPHEKVSAIIEAASLKSFDELREAHVADYKELFDRVAINLTDEIPAIPTDDLMDAYRAGNYSTYVEELIFAFGRYLLIASSRSGDLPPNLQGVWNRYHGPVCMNAYWSNVNTQMNFWSAFSTDLSECFESYVEFYNAYIASNHKNAVNALIRAGAISSASEVQGTLWAIGTGQTAFASPATSGGRDGWGNTPFMAESFWDYFDYTRDTGILTDAALPALIASANFLSLLVKYDEYSGYYLTPNSGSPEQSTTSPYINYVSQNPGYVPEGTTYDQALTYSNYMHVLEALEYIDESALTASDRAVIARIREQIDKLDPIPIGLSGQVKEFREETYYGEIGETYHRHISHLASLYPANVISDSTPAWLDAAGVSLDGRGDNFIWGWSYTHHILARARTGNGNKAHEVLRNEIKNTVANNMCTLGGGNFQIESNLGNPAGISEMLLQSHNGYIEPLAALPDAWSDGSYSGLVARGNFSVGAAWEGGLAKVVTIESRSGGAASVYYPGIANATVKTESGSKVSFTKIGENLISFETVKGETYVITGFVAVEKMEAPASLGCSVDEDGNVDLTCSSVMGAVSYKLYTAIGNASEYTLVCTSSDGKFDYKISDTKKRITFAATALGADGTESDRAIAYFVPEESISVVNVAKGEVLDSGELKITVEADSPVREYRVYSKPKMSAEYTLMATSKEPIFIAGHYSLGYNYYVTVVNAESKKESEKAYVIVAGSGSSIDLNVDNVFKGKNFTPAERATATHSGMYNGVNVKYDYTKLTDGDMHLHMGRFSTVSSSSTQVFDGIIDLGTGYFLGTLIIRDFSPSVSAAPFMGTGLEVQVYSMGKWTTVVSCGSNAEIVAHRVGNTHLAFDLGGVRAEKVRIYIPSRLGSDTISIYEIECSAVYDTTDYDYSENIVLNKPFVPTESALSQIHKDPTLDYGYNVITDNNYAAKGGRFSTRFSSTEQHVDATVDLGGTYVLGEFRIYDFNAHTEPNASNPSYVGPSITVEAYLDGVWTTVIYCTREEYPSHRVSPSGGMGAQYLSFDLGGVTAEKIRVYIPSNITGSSISFYEITVSGYKMVVHEHTPADAVKENNVAPDCTNGGRYDSVIYCNVCGEEISRETVPVPALGHSYKAEITAPDCEHGGYTTNTCTVCGHSYVSDAKDALGHSEQTVAGKAASCTENGLTDGKICTACGKTLVSQVVIPALGHTDSDKNFICDVCGEDLCTVHSEQIIEGKPATCTESGLTDGKKCSVCGEILVEQAVIDAKGHNYGAVVTAPDCVNGGYTTYTCSVCGDSYITDETEPLGHICDSVITPPTCINGGYTTYTCSVCGESYVSDETAALGHSYVAEITAPNCTSGGFTTYTCSICQDSYVSDRVEAHGHRWKDATTEAPRTCEICGDTDGERLPEPTPSPEPTPDPAPEKNHDECEGSRFWNAIINFFRRLFGLPEKCVCGDEI
jgi:hypothetical protein